MRFLHTADWHLGKLLHGVHLTADQRVLLDQLCDVVEREAPDAVIMAGDVYDRSVPPSEAVELLDDALSRLVLDLDTPVIAIAGNHDSPDRLDFGSRILRERGLHVFSKLREEAGIVTLEDEHGPVHVAGLPYAEPSAARAVFGDSDVRTHDAVTAAQADAARAEIPDDERSIAVAHVFAKGGELADSERPLAVGGAETVATARFEGFDYVALGHLHRRQQVGDPRIRYAGSLMKYSFNEVHHDKSAFLVEMDASGDCEVETIPLAPERDLHRTAGTLAEVVAGDTTDASGDPIPEDAYLWVTLENDGPVVDAMSRIRDTYPNALHVEQPRSAATTALTGAGDVHTQRPDAVFRQFFQHVTEEELTEQQEEVLAEAVDRA